MVFAQTTRQRGMGFDERHVMHVPGGIQAIQLSAAFPGGRCRSSS